MRAALLALALAGCSPAIHAAVEPVCSDCVEEGDACDMACGSISGAPGDAFAACDGDLRCRCYDNCAIRCGGECFSGGYCSAGAGACRRWGPIGCAPDGTARVACYAVPGC